MTDGEVKGDTKSYSNVMYPVDLLKEKNQSSNCKKRKKRNKKNGGSEKSKIKGVSASRLASHGLWQFRGFFLFEKEALILIISVISIRSRGRQYPMI